MRMTDEEIRKTMEFILAQQAQFAANIQRLQEEHVRDNPHLTRLEESFQLLVQLAQATDNRIDTVESKITPLESNMAALAAAQTHRDERLSALIDIVREGRNGTSWSVLTPHPASTLMKAKAKAGSTFTSKNHTLES
jgi:septal ring factor EnvC (AmiA/AmiB activator)